MLKKPELSGKTILIFGGTGSLGQALIRRLAPRNRIHVVSRDENKHWTLRNELAPELGVHFHVGDVRDRARTSMLVSELDPNVVISAAALKHVDTCERSPHESMLTNVLGVQNIIDACQESIRRRGALECMLQVSTDKACQPVNAYGMCKALAERLTVTQNVPIDRPRAKFVAVRYGNVLESRGSIIPLFRWQADNKPAFTVTDPDMTRFVMTLDDSVDLIVTAITAARHGDTWIPRIPAMRIGDLAELFSERFGKPIERIPVRPGEKRHEDLVGATEAVRTRGTPEFWHDPETWGISHYIILPPTLSLSETALQHKHLLVERYASCDEVMTKDQLKEHLQKLGVLNWPLSQFKGPSIEEIRTT